MQCKARPQRQELLAHWIDVPCVNYYQNTVRISSNDYRLRDENGFLANSISSNNQKGLSLALGYVGLESLFLNKPHTFI